MSKNKYRAINEIEIFEMGWRCEKCGKWMLICDIGKGKPPSWEWCKCDKENAKESK